MKVITLHLKHPSCLLDFILFTEVAVVIQKDEKALFSWMKVVALKKDVSLMFQRGASIFLFTIYAYKCGHYKIPFYILTIFLLFRFFFTEDVFPEGPFPYIILLHQRGNLPWVFTIFFATLPPMEDIALHYTIQSYSHFLRYTKMHCIFSLPLLCCLVWLSTEKIRGSIVTYASQAFTAFRLLYAYHSRWSFYYNYVG